MQARKQGAAQTRVMKTVPRRDEIQQKQAGSSAHSLMLTFALMCVYAGDFIACDGLFRQQQHRKFLLANCCACSPLQPGIGVLHGMRVGAQSRAGAPIQAAGGAAAGPGVSGRGAPRAVLQAANRHFYRNTPWAALPCSLVCSRASTCACMCGLASLVGLSCDHMLAFCACRPWYKRSLMSLHAAAQQHYLC